MAATGKITINNEGWTAVPKEGPFVCIQPQTPMVLLVRIDDVAPDDEDDTGLIIGHARGDTAPRSFSAGNVPDGALVYVKIKSEGQPAISADVTVMTY